MKNEETYSSVNGKYMLYYCEDGLLTLIHILDNRMKCYNFDENALDEHNCFWVHRDDQYANRYGRHFASSLEEAYEKFKKSPFIEQVDGIVYSKYKNVRFSTIKKKMALMTLGS